MNNLASSLARQPGRQADAQKWAAKALDLDSTVRPPVRTEECDRACVAATHNLGEIAHMMGDSKTARVRFEEALSLAKGLGMEEGIEAAKEGLEKAGKA